MKLFCISILSLFFISFIFANGNHMGDHMHDGKMANHERASINKNDKSKKDLGPVLYSSCQYCHGLKAEKIYGNEVPSIQRLDEDALITMLSAYKKGQLETYGYGAIMKMQMKNIPEDLIPTLAKHIKGLK